MRLICPNCDAQYDIATDVVPDIGLDVQCSSCQHTWFQKKEDLKPAPTAAPVRKALDSSVADILRQEAEFDKKVRSTPPPTLETQIDAPVVDQNETRKRIAAMADADDTQAATPAVVAASSVGAVAASKSSGDPHEKLPNIHDINESLRTRAVHNHSSGLTVEEEKEMHHRRGFRRGFVWILLLLIILALPYVFADQIAEQLPSLAEPLAQYKVLVDQVRVWVSTQLQALTAMVQDMISGTSAEVDPPAE